MAYWQFKETAYIPSYSHDGLSHQEIDPDENDWSPVNVIQRRDGQYIMVWRRQMRYACAICRAGDYPPSTKEAPEHREKPNESEVVCRGSGAPLKATTYWR